MDLDDLDAPSKVQAPSRTLRFAPKSFSKPKPKPELVPKSEPEQFLPKPEQKSDSLLAEKNDGDEVKVVPKAEPFTSNGAVKMDFVPTNSEAVEEPEKDDTMVEDDDEDMVVREIDVFFTPPTDANTQLYVLQYPMRPSWRPYELDERCEEVRVKPEAAEVEIDLAVDSDSSNYDQNFRSGPKVTKQTLSCSWKPPRTSGYAVGVLMGNKLHLNPINAIVQLRTSFEVNSGGLKRKSDVKGDKDGLIEEKPGVLPGKQNKQKESSTKLKTEDEECWIPLKYHGANSNLSANYLQRMVVQESSPIQFTMSPYDYLSSLCPGTWKNDNKPKGLSRRFLLSLPLEERIKKLLSEGPPVHRFSALKHYASDYGTEELLEVLQQHAVLVQGVWAPKSSLLFRDDMGACLARDFTLLLFSKNPVVSNSQISASKSLRDKIKRFLNTLAVERPSFRDWKFKENPDMSFVKLYPDIVQKQAKVWEVVEERITNVIAPREKSGLGTKTAISKPSVINKPGKPVNSDKGSAKSASAAPSGRRMSDETREALPKALQKLFQNHKVCSFQLICQGLRDLAVSQSSLPKADARMVVAAAYGVDAPLEDLKGVISQVATEIHGLYVLTSSLEHPEYDPLRKVVIELLLGNGPNAMLKRADVFQAAKLKLGRDITNNEYNKVMNEICVSKGSAWVLKSGDGNSN